MTKQEYLAKRKLLLLNQAAAHYDFCNGNMSTVQAAERDLQRIERELRELDAQWQQQEHNNAL